MTDAEFLDEIAGRTEHQWSRVLKLTGKIAGYYGVLYSAAERDRLVALARTGITAARERDLLLLAPDNRIDGYREMGEKCAALEERIDQLRTQLASRDEELRLLRDIRSQRRNRSGDEQRVFASLAALRARQGEQP